jgi:hypothetical protein
MGTLIFIAFIVVLLWLAGVLIHFAAGYIHLLLLVALILVVISLLDRGRTGREP